MKTLPHAAEHKASATGLFCARSWSFGRRELTAGSFGLRASHFFTVRCPQLPLALGQLLRHLGAPRVHRLPLQSAWHQGSRECSAGCGLCAPHHPAPAREAPDCLPQVRKLRFIEGRGPAAGCEPMKAGSLRPRGSDSLRSCSASLAACCSSSVSLASCT